MCVVVGGGGTLHGGNGSAQRSDLARSLELLLSGYLLVLMLPAM